MRHLWRVGALALLILAALLTAPAQARQSAAITVASSEAQPDFPSQITFALSAASSAADIRQVQLLYGATRSDALTVVDLAVTPGPQVTLSHQLDTQVSYYPPGTEITYRWVISDAAGNTLESPPQRVVYHDQRFSWGERTVRNVTIYWYKGGDAFGDDLAAAVERALTHLQSELGTDLTEPVRIYIYATNSDMRSALRANSEEWIGGEANPVLGVIVAAITAGDDAEVRRIIPHELSHQVLHQAITNPYGGAPPWFDEGLAVHNQEVRDSNFDQLIAQAAAQNRLIPLEALASSFPADPDQALLSYAQSRDMVEHIIDTYGEAKLQALVAAFATATPVDETVQQVLGRSISDLDAEWRKGQPAPEGPAPDLAGPQVAPAERFSDPPVLPSGAAPPASAASPTLPQPFEDRPPALIGWLGSLPAWATLSAAAVCCITGVIILGAALLVGLRLIGVDKQG
ncbi:MAG: peptidase MA family metallohydrolase [Chloroflexales bacterium]